MASPDLYLVSDLHWGGDGQLQICEYKPQFIEWLKSLCTLGPEAELLIIGDTFGLWESTLIKGPPAMEEIIRHHQDIFDQLKITGERIKITLMAGNHDYDLVCDPTYADILARYNIHFEAAVSVTRDVAGKRIWIEHGQQFDVFNRSEDYGNRYALPPGFFITETVVGSASRHSEFGKGNWLKDIRSVATMQIPDWVISNYFYREMSSYLRWLLVPFLLLFGASALVLIGGAISVAGLTTENIVLNNPLIRWSGAFGDLVRLVLMINAIVLLFLLILSIPLVFVVKDMRRTLQRFHLMSKEGFDPDVDSIEPYLDGARKVFNDHPEVSVFVFGHTHVAFLHEHPDDRRIVLNTGTWLKLLHRVAVRIGYLPAVYVPTFRLNFFRVHEVDGEAVIDYTEVPRPAPNELTWLQRLVLMGRKAPAAEPIPSRTVIRAAASVREALSTSPGPV